MTEKRVLLLGANGYIGQKILPALRKEQIKVMPYDRNSKESFENVKNFSPNTVINLAASKGNDNFPISYEANLLFQLKIIQFLSEEVGNRVHWIQAASYFELQIEEGRRDFYAVHKATLRKVLEENIFRNIDLTTLFLPHIVSFENKKSSLFTQIAKAINGEKIKLLTSGDQIVPILHMDDCVWAIIKSLDAKQGSYFATPIWNENLKELQKVLSKRVGTSFNFTPDNKSSDWNFKKIEFKPSVPGWEPRKNIESIFDELAKVEDKS